MRTGVQACLVPSQPVTRRPAAGRQVRLGEKEGLASTLRFFEDRLARLDRLEYYQERRLKNLGLMVRELQEAAGSDIRGL